MPWIASRSLGDMFHVGAGTAATQNSRVAADAAGATTEVAAPSHSHDGHDRGQTSHWHDVTVPFMNGWIMQ